MSQPVYSRMPSAELRPLASQGPVFQRTVVLAEILSRGGVLLSNDEELLCQVDLLLAYDPLESPVIPVLVRQVLSRPDEYDSLLRRGRFGRVRDRARAAMILGALPVLEERAEPILEGLLRDSVPAVWRAAARSWWRQRARCTSAGVVPADWHLPKEFPERSESQIRHLSGGLAGLAVTRPVDATVLVAELLDHPAPWVRANAGISCAEIAVRSSQQSDTARIWRQFLEDRSVPVLRGMAFGLKEAGRPTACQPTAVSLAKDLSEALRTVEPKGEKDRSDLQRIRRILQPVLDYQQNMPLHAGADYSRHLERLYAQVLSSTQCHPVTEMVEAIHMATGWDDRQGSLLSRGSTESRAERCGDFASVVESVFGFDHLGPLLEVVAAKPEDRRVLRQALRNLHHRLLDDASQLSKSDSFVEKQEGIRAIALSVDADPHSCREMVCQLLEWAASSQTRMHAINAIGRLLDRIYGDDPDGFVDVSLRFAMLPKDKMETLLSRLMAVTTHPMVTSFFAILAEDMKALDANPRAIAAADILEGLARRCRERLAHDPDFESPGAHPALAAVTAAALSIRSLRGGKPVRDDALSECLSSLRQMEANLPWNAPLPPDHDELRALADQVSAVLGLGVTRASEKDQFAGHLRALADAIDSKFHCFIAPLLVAALRRAAKAVRSKSVRPPPEGHGALRPGDAVHDYFVVSLLHQSNLSCVYTGRHRGTRVKAVLKIPSQTVWDDTEARAQFLFEAQLLSLLPSEHVVRVHQVYPDGPPMLVLQYLSGRKLGDLLGENQRFLLRRCLDILRGLRHAHDYGVVHRDLKPDNVMVAPSGRAILIDFGLAYLPMDFSNLEDPAELPSGTPVFMAPEQWNGEAPTAATDLYALGVLLYRILTGRYPFEGSVMALRYAHLCTPPPPWPEDALPQLAVIVDRCLEKEPEKRPRIGEIQRAIEDALAQLAQPTETMAHSDIPIRDSSPASTCLPTEPAIDVGGRGTVQLSRTISGLGTVSTSSGDEPVDGTEGPGDHENPLPVKDTPR